MAELADAADLKSAGPKGLWGFESPSRHHSLDRERNQAPSARLSRNGVGGVRNPHLLLHFSASACAYGWSVMTSNVEDGWLQIHPAVVIEADSAQTSHSLQGPPMIRRKLRYIQSLNRMPITQLSSLGETSIRSTNLAFYLRGSVSLP